MTFYLPKKNNLGCRGWYSRAIAPPPYQLAAKSSKFNTMQEIRAYYRTPPPPRPPSPLSLPPSTSPINPYRKVRTLSISKRCSSPLFENLKTFAQTQDLLFTPAHLNALTPRADTPVFKHHFTRVRVANYDQVHLTEDHPHRLADLFESNTIVLKIYSGGVINAPQGLLLRKNGEYMTDSSGHRYILVDRIPHDKWVIGPTQI